jgi:hypothetical protein
MTDKDDRESIDKIYIHKNYRIHDRQDIDNAIDRSGRQSRVGSLIQTRKLIKW